MTASELFREIELLVPKLDGWCIPEKACDFAAIILATRPEISCEIGVFAGRGALTMAMAHRFVGWGRVIAIDPWKAAASVVGQTGKNAEWWADENMHELVYNKFMASIDMLKLNDWITVQRARSDDAVLPSQIQFCVSDGNHSEQAIADVRRYAPLIPVGGTMFLDDLNWTGGAVARAADALKEMGFRQVFKRDQGAFFQRTSQPHVPKRKPIR